MYARRYEVAFHLVEDLAGPMRAKRVMLDETQKQVAFPEANQNVRVQHDDGMQVGRHDGSGLLLLAFAVVAAGLLTQSHEPPHASLALCISLPLER